MGIVYPPGHNLCSEINIKIVSITRYRRIGSGSVILFIIIGNE